MTPDLIEEVNLLFFDIGGRLYGADASQVLRVDRPEAHAFERPELGKLASGERALVFRSGEGEGQLRVDGVRGVRRVTVDHLRRIPPAAHASQYALGFLLEGETPILLLNLSESLKGGQ
jgi:chemotaxis signal transduction protein